MVLKVEVKLLKEKLFNLRDRIAFIFMMLAQSRETLRSGGGTNPRYRFFKLYMH